MRWLKARSNKTDENRAMLDEPYFQAKNPLIFPFESLFEVIYYFTILENFYFLVLVVILLPDFVRFLAESLFYFSV